MQKRFSFETKSRTTLFRDEGSHFPQKAHDGFQINCRNSPVAFGVTQNLSHACEDSCTKLKMVLLRLTKYVTLFTRVKIAPKYLFFTPTFTLLFWYQVALVFLTHAHFRYSTLRQKGVSHTGGYGIWYAFSRAETSVMNHSHFV